MTYELADGYKIRNQYGAHFLTFSIVGWIDLFSRQSYRDVLIESLKFCICNKGLQVGAFVIMSNHVHFIWTSENGNLSGLIRDFKCYTSKTFIDWMMKEPESRKNWLLHMFQYYAEGTKANDYYKVWTGNNHPEEIFSEKFGRCKLDIFMKTR